MAPSTKNRILKAAAELFFRRGFSLVKIEDIADYLGISKKTIYNHFAGKEQLIDRVTEERIGEMLQSLDTQAAAERPFMAKLEGILRSAAEELRALEKLRANSPPAITRLLYGSLRDKITALTETLITEGIEEGLFRQDLPREILPQLYVGIIESYINLPTHQGEFPPIHELVDITQKCLLEGLLTDKARKTMTASVPKAVTP